MRPASALAVGLLAPLGTAWPLSFNGIIKKRAAGFTPLRFTSDGTFQISVFNDLHYGEGEQDLAPRVLYLSMTVIDRPGTQGKARSPAGGRTSSPTRL